jgi:pyruvate dehydrogenase E2 component (dihydrolipoamide acetyltransferase)
MPDFLLPDLGEGLDQAEIVSWRVKVGDLVLVDQIVAEVETAKAVVEIPTPFAGRVSALHAQPGTTVAVGAALLTVTPEGVDSVEPPTGIREPIGTVVDDACEGSGSVLVGYGTSTLPRRNRGRAAVGAPPAHTSQSKSTPRPAAGSPKSDRLIRVSSPLVRRLAHDAGLDLADIAGTGPDGLVRRHDVEQAISGVQHGVTTALAMALPQPIERGSLVAASDGETRVPIRGVRRVVADKLSRSRREIPEATVWVDVDATEFTAARASMNERSPKQAVSVLALLARFTILGLRRYPQLNARIEHNEIDFLDHVNLGFAVQTEHGLVVPVAREADHLTTRGLSSVLAALTAAARSGRLAPADVTRGTFTVNNYGVFGVDGAAAIINYPEVAILGMGRIIDRPWVADGQLTVRKVSQLSLAFDHRVCDGSTAGGFLRYVADCIESPFAVIADL